MSDGRPDEIPHLTVPHAITPFYLTHAPVRGRLVRLGPLADAMLCRHASLPDSVLTLGGEALALVAAMATALKFEGSFSLQVRGDGPVSLFLADCTESGALRFTARLSEKYSATSSPDSLSQKPEELFGKGFLAFTVDQGDEMERYQGIVSIEGDTLAQMAEHYYATSAQQPCSIHLFARKALCDGDERWQAGALILERIAGSGGIVADNDDESAASEQDSETIADSWETACTFATTLGTTELFDPKLNNQALIHRLFGTLGVRCDETRPLSYGCRCHRTRLADILSRFSEDDLDHMAEDGIISMDCGFCNVKFQFPRHDVRGLS